MITSEGLLIDAAITLQKAGAAGMPLADLARALWPDAGVRAHGAVGGVLRELERRGVVSLTPGGKRRRAALTDAGREWIETYSIEGAALDAELVESYQPRHRPAPAPPVDPLTAAVEAACQHPPPSPLPAGTPSWAAYAQGQTQGRARAERSIAQIRQASRSPAEFQAAVAEMERRTAQQIRELEGEMLARGLDPHAFSH